MADLLNFIMLSILEIWCFRTKSYKDQHFIYDFLLVMFEKRLEFHVIIIPIPYLFLLTNHDVLDVSQPFHLGQVSFWE